MSKSPQPSDLRIALVFHGPGGGGAERVVLTLANEFLARDIAVDLVMLHRDGPLQKYIPKKARLFDIHPVPRWMFSISVLRGPRNLLPVLSKKRNQRHAIRQAPAISKYLRREQPSAVIASELPYNLASLLAREWSGKKIPVITREDCNINEYLASRKPHDREIFRTLVRGLYPRADSLVAVSEGVSDSIRELVDVDSDHLRVIHNPIVSDSLQVKAFKQVDHPWLAQHKVVLAVGRIHPQKDYPMLLRALARLRTRQSIKLLILGTTQDKKYQEELEGIADDLGVSGDVAFLGFVENPYAYMRRASLLALSSSFEGLPTVLIEALACGTPVVSTDCPSGPAEILDNGAYGPLVPVGDDVAFANAMKNVLDNPPDPQRLKNRAAMFSVEKSVDSYLELIESCIRKRAKGIA
jgi:glycosyltransferase involved in cell wall biosynthesis